MDPDIPDAFTEPMVQQDEYYFHPGRGHLYQVVAITNFQSAEKKHDNARSVLYMRITMEELRGMNRGYAIDYSKCFTRLEKEFLDGRFQKVDFDD